MAGKSRLEARIGTRCNGLRRACSSPGGDLRDRGSIMTSRTVFLSAVSGEFREARKALARELRKAGCAVMEQSEFHLEPANATFLGKLHACVESWSGTSAHSRCGSSLFPGIRI
jgi:hypothetical protein